MSSVSVLAKTSTQLDLPNEDDADVVRVDEEKDFFRKVWFKTKPVSLDFCHRVIQLQLSTDSRDQGWVSDAKQGSWSWFEVAIFENETSTEPKVSDGRVLSWRSHANRMGDETGNHSRHFGTIFDRRSEILDDLEEGNVIAVIGYTRFVGWENHGKHAELHVNLADQPLFTPNHWTLASEDTPDIDDTVQDGIYTILPTSTASVVAKDADLASKIWIKSPVLTESIIKRLEAVQLFTNAHDQGFAELESTSSWSWFDIIILDSLTSTVPKTRNGVTLAWSSHTNDIGSKHPTNREGEVYERESDLLSSLEPGDVIAVRVCARFPGWANYAKSGRLVIRISNEGKYVPPKSNKQIAEFVEGRRSLQQQLWDYYQSLAVDGAPPPYSATTELLLRGPRADMMVGAGEAPLRLLSLDGGGVRGVSSLATLAEIMKKVCPDVADPWSIRPREYFDMMCGTSTGGLIAIMLGRLGLTLGQCRDEYKNLSRKLFEKGWIAKQVSKAGLVVGKAQYDHKVFEEEIKNIVKKYSGSRDTAMLDPALKDPKKANEHQCRVFVMATRQDNVNNNSAVHIRTYVNNNAPADPLGPEVNVKNAPPQQEWKIWQAARATSAAPSYFQPLQHGHYSFVDGGLGFNNPSLELVSEVALEFGWLRDIGCLLTIGTGIAPNVRLGNVSGGDVPDLVSGLVATATSCERAHEQMERISTGLPSSKDASKYYRFNVGKKLNAKFVREHVGGHFGYGGSDITVFKPEDFEKGIIEMDDWEAMDGFVKLTNAYMALDEQKARVDRCAQRLLKGAGAIAVKA